MLYVETLLKKGEKKSGVQVIKVVIMIPLPMKLVGKWKPLYTIT